MAGDRLIRGALRTSAVFNLAGALIGPLLIGAITAATASQKAGMAVLVVFFVAGLALLTRVRE